MAIKYGQRNELMTQNEERKVMIMEKKMRVDQILKTKQNLA